MTPVDSDPPTEPASLPAPEPVSVDTPVDPPFEASLDATVLALDEDGDAVSPSLVCAILPFVTQPAHAAPYPRIDRQVGVSGGQPIVAGTRIPVATIVRSQQLGMDFDEILVQYPTLSAADLHAAMLYYLDHREEIDALLRVAEHPVDGAVIVRG